MYTNGATADAPPNTIKTAKSNKIKIVGISHHFLRATKNLQISVINCMLCYVINLIDNYFANHYVQSNLVVPFYQK